MSNQNSDVQENLASGNISSSPKQDDSGKEGLKQKLLELRRHSFGMRDFPALVKAIFSDDDHQNIYGTLGVRKLLSNRNAPIQETIEANLVPKLIEFMQDGNNSGLQHEAVRALGYIALGTTQQVQYIIDNGALPGFVRLVSSPKLKIAVQAIWGIGSMAKNSTSIRDEVINSGVLEPLIDLVDHSNNEEIVKYGTRAISNQCRGKPKPNFELVKFATPTLCRVIINNTDLATLKHASKGLEFLTRDFIEIEDLAKQLIACLIQYMDHLDLKLSWYCVRTLGHLGLNNLNQEIALAHPEYLPKLFQLTCRSRAICKTACRIISKLTAGDSNQIQAVIGNHHYVDMLIKLAISNDTKIRFEAASVLANSTTKASLKQIAEMIDLGVLDCLLYFIHSKHPNLVCLVAECVLEILNKGVQVDKVGRVTNEFLNILKDKGGNKKIEKLQSHSDEKVCLIAKNIFERHF